jgi:precorrin-2 dehydrogenase/sirohydrochlorin ferrochelatase
VRVVSPEITPGIEKLAAEGRIDCQRRQFRPSDLEGVFLVIGSTNQETVNRQVAEEGAARNLLVNIVDDPRKGNFFVPSITRRGSLTIAVSTDGKSPMLARKIREELEVIFGPQYQEYLDLVGKLREDVIRNVQDPEKKREILESFADDKVLGLLKEGRLAEVKERLLNAYCGCRP